MSDTVNSIIVSGLRKIGLPPAQQPMPSGMIQRGLEILNDILDMWGGSRLFIPYQNLIFLPLVANQEMYTVGEFDPIITPGLYDLNSKPIINVLECNIEDPNSPGVDYPIQAMTENMYANIAYKLTTGIPTEYLLRNYPDYCELRFQSVPYTNLTAKILVKDRLERVALTDDLSAIPRFYLLALKYKIAINAANVWGRPLTPEFKQEATEAMNVLAASVANIDYTVRRDEQINRKNVVFFNWWI